MISFKELYENTIFNVQIFLDDEQCCHVCGEYMTEEKYHSDFLCKKCYRIISERDDIKFYICPEHNVICAIENELYPDKELFADFKDDFSKILVYKVSENGLELKPSFSNLIEAFNNFKIKKFKNNELEENECPWYYADLYYQGAIKEIKKIKKRK